MPCTNPPQAFAGGWEAPDCPPRLSQGVASESVLLAEAHTLLALVPEGNEHTVQAATVALREPDAGAAWSKTNYEARIHS